MGEINYAEVGKRIREVRKAQKLTQEVAAERCDITSSYYGNIERGNKKMSLETLGKISRGLGVSADTLLFGTEQKQKDELKDILRDVKRRADEKQLEKYLVIIKSIATIIDQL